MGVEGSRSDSEGILGTGGLMNPESPTPVASKTSEPGAEQAGSGSCQKKKFAQSGSVSSGVEIVHLFCSMTV